jgi:hypothetical protein
MPRALRTNANIGLARARTSLADVARAMDVPVVVATRNDPGGSQTHSSHGLDFGVNWSEFVAAVDAQCTKGATIIPNIQVNPAFYPWIAPLVARDIRFLVAIPLCDHDGWRVGSIAVVASHKAVARKGVPVRLLGELGRSFIGISRDAFV